MFQSSGKFQPLVDQLERVAPAIIEMGCFSRIETNGGAFEQVNLMAGENPNNAVRRFTKPFNEAGIQTHMLDRALNALRMFPVPADVRRLMYKVKKAQGVDITRIFCGLNDTRNIIPSIKYALEAGMIPQATLCITSSPIHTVEYYSNTADELISAGATEICLKDMAGIGRPDFLGRLVKSIKEKHPEIIIRKLADRHFTCIFLITVSILLYSIVNTVGFDLFFGHFGGKRCRQFLQERINCQTQRRTEVIRHIFTLFYVKGDIFPDPFLILSAGSRSLTAQLVNFVACRFRSGTVRTPLEKEQQCANQQYD